MTQPTTRSPLILAPAESHALALTASKTSGIELAELEDRSYDGGEFKLRPLQSVRERSVFVVQSLAENQGVVMAHRLLRLLFLLQTLRDAGASCVTALIPYLAYARKDRRTKPRDPVYTRYVAQLIEATGTNRVVALDVHNVSAFENAFRIPVDHLSALPMMAAHFDRHLPTGSLAVVSPDIGGVKRAQTFRELLERKTSRKVELLFVEKHRDGRNVSGGTIIGNANGHHAIILDDLCATGATLLQAAKALHAAGATSVHTAVTHFPIETGLKTLATSKEVAQVVVTDSVGYAPDISRSPDGAKITTLSAGELVGHAIARLARGESMAPLADQWPPPPIG
jgi:ribose-phosphate pyrophosphokinase